MKLREKVRATAVVDLYITGSANLMLTKAQVMMTEAAAASSAQPSTPDPLSFDSKTVINTKKAIEVFLGTVSHACMHACMHKYSVNRGAHRLV